MFKETPTTTHSTFTYSRLHAHYQNHKWKDILLKKTAHFPPTSSPRHHHHHPVNNVGRMYDFPDEFSNIDAQLVWDILNINIGAVTMLTRLIINDMKHRGRGAIVNVSSGSEMQPMPYMAVYAASKVYVKNFTLAIRHELAQYGICVQLVSPMFVRTKMNQFSSTVMAGNLLIPDVRAYTRSAVYCLGKTDITTGYVAHGIQAGLMRLVPMWVRTYVGAKMNERFRSEYYVQQQQQAAAAVGVH